MKKGLIYFIVFAGLITLVLSKLSNQEFIMKNIISEQQVNQIISEKDIDLNEFVSLYKSGSFEKIELVDTINLKGYKFIEKKIEKSIFNMVYNIHYYNVYNTKKPFESTIKDIGIVLSGSAPLTVKYNEKSGISKYFLDQILPLFIVIILLVLAFKLFGPKGGGFPFGVQIGKLKTKAEVNTTFKDVAGADEAKQEVEEIVDYLKNFDKYKKVKARIPRGALLYGPPGSGKTLLARAIAGEANVPFYTASGSEFMEMLVGMGAAKVRDLFKKAKSTAPSIIFIDELDTIGKKRGLGYTGGHQEQEQTLNQILTEIDGFEKDTNVIVIAATNRPDILDPALLRPGRFDRKVYVGRPTLEERLLIINLHTKDKKLDKNVDLKMLSRRTSGFVGADIENLINEVALKTAKENREVLTVEDFEYALEKIVMGPEKKIKSLKEKERKIVAYHELGHAISAYFLPNIDPVEKISIVSRGMALGVTWMMPQEDRYLYSKIKFEEELVTLLGGRVAEELFFGIDEITTGASNDFEKATEIATDMIVKYGMDEELGTVLYFNKEKVEFLPFKPYSEKTAEIIDKKIKIKLDTAYKKAKKILQTNSETIHKLVLLLLEKEYLTKEEFQTAMSDINSIDIMLADYKSKSKIDLENKLEKQNSEKIFKIKKKKNKLNELLDKFLKKD